MGSKVSRLCKDFNLKSSCVSNCCSDGSKNNVNLEKDHEDKIQDKYKHKHKHKHKDKHKHNEADIVVG